MKLHPVAEAVIGGVVLALATAGPLVDDGLVPSEIIAIVLAGIGGSGLTAMIPSRKR